MSISIKLVESELTTAHKVILIERVSEYGVYLSAEDYLLAKQAFEQKQPNYYVSAGGKSTIILLIDNAKEKYKVLEEARKAAYQLTRQLNERKIEVIGIESLITLHGVGIAFLEGMLMSSYQFLKYKTKDLKTNTLKKLEVSSTLIAPTELDALEIGCRGTLIARDLINEPLSYLTAEQLSLEIEQLGREAGFTTTILGKNEIETLKMGGLLAVNRGSQRPPTFNILEHRPADAKNGKPIVLVGKGVVYDTGGLSLKPTLNSMDMMKCDMSGAATVVGVLYAIALLKLPVHVVGLIPATDNRPGEDAYVPGDVVPMMNGMNVEVLNTDAEGRMILADALHYAERYSPELVCDFATLTGAAKAAISSVGTVYMGTASDAVKAQIVRAGNAVYERVVELPLWEEYGELIKSDVADMKNVGGSEAGAITAGKFLEHFTTHPWLHFDIAGPAYLTKEDSYRGKYGTGVGVRMMIEFLKNC